jgi:HSP20 family molecular chaperone IbpA
LDKRKRERRGDSKFGERGKEQNVSQNDELRRRMEDLFSDIDEEFGYISSRLNDLFFRFQSLIRNLTAFGLIERYLPNALPERIASPRRNHFDLVNFNSEVLRRFMLSREEPLVETAIDERRGELRILVIMPGVRKEDIELELTDNMVTARSLAGGDKRSITVPLPVPVKMRSIETSYANGVLEVRLKLKNPKRYYKVKIK